MKTEMKTILVTGGAGFIGTNFIRFVLSERPEWQIFSNECLSDQINLQTLIEISAK